MYYEDSADFAASLDRDDPLAGFRDQFEFPSQRGGKPHARGSPTIAMRPVRSQP
jgi:hypothetical protein